MTATLLGKLVIGWTVIGMLMALVCAYFVGYNKAVREAEPFVVEGVQYVCYGDEVHTYGTVQYVKD